MSYCLCWDSPSNDLWIAERDYGQTYQQVIGGFGSVVFEGSLEECQERYNKWRDDTTYAVYYHRALSADDKDRFYIIPIKTGGGTYQENALEYGDNWVKSFDNKEEAEKYIEEV